MSQTSNHPQPPGGGNPQPQTQRAAPQQENSFSTLVTANILALMVGAVIGIVFTQIVDREFNLSEAWPVIPIAGVAILIYTWFAIKKNVNPWLSGGITIILVLFSFWSLYLLSDKPAVAKNCPETPPDAPDYIFTDEFVFHDRFPQAPSPAYYDERYACDNDPIPWGNGGGQISVELEVKEFAPAMLYWKFGQAHEASFEVKVGGEILDRYQDGIRASHEMPYSDCKLSEGVAIDSQLTESGVINVTISDIPGNRPPGETDFIASYLCVYSKK